MALFRSLLAGLAGGAGPAFWLPGQRADLREHTSHHPGEERIAGSRVWQGVLGPPLRQRKVTCEERAICRCGQDRYAQLRRAGADLGHAGLGPAADGTG